MVSKKVKPKKEHKPWTKMPWKWGQNLSIWYRFGLIGCYYFRLMLLEGKSRPWFPQNIQPIGSSIRDQIRSTPPVQSHQSPYFYGWEAKHLEHSGRSRISQRRGANHKGGGSNLLFWPIFPKNCMEMKNIWPQTGARVPWIRCRKAIYFE